MALHLGRVGVDHLLVLNAAGDEAKLISQAAGHELNLTLGGTVEAAAESGEQADDDRVRVTLHSVERFNHRQLTLPLVKLLDDRCEVGNQERRVVQTLGNSVVDDVRYGAECVNVEDLSL